MSRRTTFVAIALLASLALGASACTDVTAPQAGCTSHQGSGTTCLQASHQGSGT